MGWYAIDDMILLMQEEMTMGGESIFVIYFTLIIFRITRKVHCDGEEEEDYLNGNYSWLLLFSWSLVMMMKDVACVWMMSCMFG
jgi:hypothetical protein